MRVWGTPCAILSNFTKLTGTLFLNAKSVPAKILGKAQNVHVSSLKPYLQPCTVAFI